MCTRSYVVTPHPELPQDIPTDLVIPTDVCPHCHRARVSVTRSQHGTHPWLIRWACGSAVKIGAKPILNLSRECQDLFTGGL